MCHLGTLHTTTTGSPHLGQLFHAKTIHFQNKQGHALRAKFDQDILYGERERVHKVASQQLQEFADYNNSKVAVKLLEDTQLEITKFNAIFHQRVATLHALEQRPTQQEFDDMKKRAEDAEAQLSFYKQRAEQAEENAMKELQLRRSLVGQARTVPEVAQHSTYPTLQPHYGFLPDESTLVNLGDDEEEDVSTWEILPSQ